MLASPGVMAEAPRPVWKNDQRRGRSTAHFIDIVGYFDFPLKRLPADYHVGFDDFSSLFQIGSRFVHVQTNGMNFVAGSF